MGIIQISYVNNSDAATLSGGSWTTALPLANLQTRTQSKVARTTNAAIGSTLFNVDFGVASTIVRLVGLWRHNLSTGALYRVTAGTTAGGSDVYNSDWQSVWPSVFLPQDVEWEADNWWTGALTQAEAAGYPFALLHDVGRNTLARYWRVEINDTANTAGYIEIGRLWMGPLWSPSRQYSFGATLVWEPRSEEERSLGGVLYFDEQPAVRVFSFDLAAASDIEAFGTLLDVQRLARNDREVVVIPDPDDTPRRFKRDMLGRLRKSNPLAQIAHGYQSAGFEVEELL